MNHCFVFFFTLVLLELRAVVSFATLRSQQFISSSPLYSTPPVTSIKEELEQQPSPPANIQQSLQSLASTTLSLLSGDENAAVHASQKRHVVTNVFKAYDVCESGTLSLEEARSLFADLARSMVLELSKGGSSDEDGENVSPAKAHAQRVLADDEAGNTIDRVANKLLLIADTDGDGRINLQELAQLFETVFEANHSDSSSDGAVSGTFPQPLRALAGSLQLLPPRERAIASEAADRSALWNVGVPGDDHSLRRVVLEVKGKGKNSDSLSLVGLGLSADASAYFLPELGIALDAGIHVSSILPKTVLLTHGHRDHIGALPVHMSKGAMCLVPRLIEPLVNSFLLAEAQLNYGDPNQTDEETILALGKFNVVGVDDRCRIMLPKDKYMGSPTPIGVQVFSAPHKEGVPACSYGVFRQKQRLKPEFQEMSKSEIGAFLREKRSAGSNDDLIITESYDEGVIFYTGDTTITLLRERWKEILPKYKYVIHEVTFLGPPSSDLDASVRAKGHTHYAQLHPWILAFPQTTFICVHWSLRYSKEEIISWFDKNYNGVPKNVVLWL